MDMEDLICLDDFVAGRIDATESESEFKDYFRRKINAIDIPEEISSGGMALVRTTDVLPMGGKIRPSNNSPFVLKNYSGYRNAVGQILREQNSELWNKSLFDDEAQKKVKSIQEPYIPYNSQYRSTIHFTINSLVGNHSAGNFDNSPYVIIEPFDRHIDEEKIVSIRPEDTIFQQDIDLSDESVILMDEKAYDRISYGQRKNIAEKTDIYLYRGDKDMATQKLLLSLGYIPERVNSHGLIESDTSDSLEKGIESVIKDLDSIKEYTLPHQYTDEYTEDLKKSLVIWEKYDRAFLEHYVREFNLDESIIEDLLDENKGCNIMKSLIEEQGLEKYKETVQIFNGTIDKKIKEGKMPTNEEILDGAEIVTSDELSKTKENIKSQELD